MKGKYIYAIFFILLLTTIIFGQVRRPIYGKYLDVDSFVVSPLLLSDSISVSKIYNQDSSKIYINSQRDTTLYIHNNSSVGIYSKTKNDFAVYGVSNGEYGVYGYANNYGVYGYAVDDYGVYGSTSNNYGVYGEATNYGIYGKGVNFGLFGYGDNYAVAGSTDADTDTCFWAKRGVSVFNDEIYGNLTGHITGTSDSSIYAETLLVWDTLEVYPDTSNIIHGVDIDSVNPECTDTFVVVSGITSNSFVSGANIYADICLSAPVTITVTTDTIKFHICADDTAVIKNHRIGCLYIP